MAPDARASGSASHGREEPALGAGPCRSSRWAPSSDRRTRSKSGGRSGSSCAARRARAGRPTVERSTCSMLAGSSSPSSRISAWRRSGRSAIRSPSRSIRGGRLGSSSRIAPVGSSASCTRAMASSLDIEGRVAVAELELEPLRAAASGDFRLVEVPRFPPVRRDLAFVLDDDVPAGAVKAALEAAAGELLDRSRALRRLPRRCHPRRDARASRSRWSSAPPTAPSRTRRSNRSSARIVDRLRAELGAELRALSLDRRVGQVPLDSRDAPLPERRRPLRRPSCPRSSSLAAELKADASSHTRGALGPLDRADLREAVDPDTRVSFEVGVGQLGAPPGRPVLGRAAARPRRDDRGHGPRPVPLRRRHRAPHLRTGTAGGALHHRHRAGRQRALRLRASMSGARGPPDDPGAPGRALRAGSSPTSATATTWRTPVARRDEGGDDRPGRDAAGFEPIPQVVHRAEEIAAETGGAVEITHDPEEAAIGAHVALHRRLDQHGPGPRDGRARARVPHATS